MLAGDHFGRVATRDLLEEKVIRNSERASVRGSKRGVDQIQVDDFAENGIVAHKLDLVVDRTAEMRRLEARRAYG